MPLAKIRVLEGRKDQNRISIRSAPPVPPLPVLSVPKSSAQRIIATSIAGARLRVRNRRTVIYPGANRFSSQYVCSNANRALKRLGEKHFQRASCHLPSFHPLSAARKIRKVNFWYNLSETFFYND